MMNAMVQTNNLITQVNCLMASDTTITGTQVIIGVVIGLAISAVIFGVGYWLSNK